MTQNFSVQNADWRAKHSSGLECQGEGGACSCTRRQGPTKMKKQRHSAAEISSKLQQADEMSAQDKLNRETVRTLGISAMTYHRWRKMRNVMPSVPVGERAGARLSHEHASRIQELELENTRLRRLFADLMLEKCGLEDALKGRR